jgi:hypothetical protein
LAALFSNVEVEALREGRERLQSRLFCRLLAALADAHAQPHRGHWATLARAFECALCRQLLPSAAHAPLAPCAPPAAALSPRGRLGHAHLRY